MIRRKKAQMWPEAVQGFPTPIKEMFAREPNDIHHSVFNVSGTRFQVSPGAQNC